MIIRAFIFLIVLAIGSSAFATTTIDVQELRGLAALVNNNVTVQELRGMGVICCIGLGIEELRGRVALVPVLGGSSGSMMMRGVGN